MLAPGKPDIPKELSDESIMLTADDASKCKKVAVQKGYWKDDFISSMVHCPSQRKAPEINRGYFARTEGVWNLIGEFIRVASPDSQIINLGAGLDTTYWRLNSPTVQCNKFIEVDFPNLTRKKMHLIESSPKLKSSLENPNFNNAEARLHSKHYFLIGCDLQYLDVLRTELLDCGIDFDKPTLFLTECVLMYMHLSVSGDLLQFVSSNFTRPVFISYDTINMNDTFGMVMVNNLKQRQCWLHGIEGSLTSETQKQRFRKNGWKTADVMTMWEVYQKLPSRAIIERLEFLDENELLKQLLEHYCFVIAYNGDEFNSLKLLFK